MKNSILEIIFIILLGIIFLQSVSETIHDMKNKKPIYTTTWYIFIFLASVLYLSHNTELWK